MSHRISSENAAEGHIKHSTARSPTALRFLLISLLAAGLLTSLTILAVRIESVLDPLARFETTSGGEPNQIYSVYKASTGFPVYSDPRQPPYPTSLYNWFFYYGYSAIARGFVNSPSAFISATRLTTAGFAALLFAAFLWHGRLIEVESGRRDTRIRIATVLFAGWAALSTFFGWWILTCRPDYAATSLSALGLVFFLKTDQTPKFWPHAVAGVFLFYLAWAMKQSFVLGPVVVCLSALCTGRRQLGYFVGGSFLLAVLGTVLFQGENYVWNTLVAVRLSPFSFHNALDAAKGALPKTLFVIGAAAVGACSLKEPTVSAFRRTCLLTGALLGSVMAGVGTFRFGASANYYFECNVFLVVLGIHGLSRVLAFSPSAPKARHLAFLTILSTASGCLVGDLSRFVRQTGRLKFDLSGAHVAEFSRVADTLIASEKPALCSLTVLSYPWLTQFPAVILDDYHYVHQPAVQKGLIAGGPKQLVADGYFATLVLERESEMLGWIDDSQYRRDLLSDNFIVFRRHP